MTRKTGPLGAHGLASGTGHLLLHACIAMLSWLIGLVLMDLISKGYLWCNPILWVPGFLLGFCVNRHFHHRVAIVVGSAGLLWIAYGVASISFHSEFHWATFKPVMEHTFFPLQKRDCERGECLGYALVTLPALTSVAYSVGASLGLLFRE